MADEEDNVASVEYVSITDFRAKLAGYLDLVAEGLVVCITFHDKPVAYIVPPDMMEGV